MKWIRFIVPVPIPNDDETPFIHYIANNCFPDAIHQPYSNGTATLSAFNPFIINGSYEICPYVGQILPSTCEQKTCKHSHHYLLHNLQRRQKPTHRLPLGQRQCVEAAKDITALNETHNQSFSFRMVYVHHAHRFPDPPSYSEWRECINLLL